MSLIGDAFRAGKKEENVRGQRDLIVEALRHKVGCKTSQWRGNVQMFMQKVSSENLFSIGYCFKSDFSVVEKNNRIFI